jgi:nicotinamidase/pyrazinamidase
MSILFWNVDTEKDFMYSTGALYVPGAEKIISNLEHLTRFARCYDIPVVNTADLHTNDSAEFSQFPKHCLEGTDGQQFIPETRPEDAYTISWKDKNFDPERVAHTRNLTLYKDGVDVFLMPHTNQVLNIMRPEVVVVYGVVTEICVDKAVTGHALNGSQVYVVTDAIKELPGCDIDALFDKWRKEYGVKFTTTKGVKTLVEEYW